MSRLPRFPQPPANYDYQNEAAFRREVATWLSGVQGLAAPASSVAWADITGKPSTISGFGLTDAQSKIERAIVSVTTAELANNAEETGTITLGKTGLIVNVAADIACWVRLYGTSAERTADATRAITEDPEDGVAVLADLIFDASHLTIPCAPLIGYSNRDGTPIANIYYSIINKSGVSDTVTVDFTRMVLEN